MAASMKMAASIPDKKLMKKMRKHHQMLINREHLAITEKPTSILCVSNGGLENGISYEEIDTLFSVHGDCDVIMLPRKSYCIVAFTSVESAEAALTSLKGHMLPADNNRKSEVILYLAYIEKAPVGLTPSTELPPGLILLQDFVSQDYADQILQSVEWSSSSEPSAATDTSVSQRALKHRRVKHYGYEFKYSINNVDPDDPLPQGVPDVFKPMLDKLLADGVIEYYPDQLTVNQYQPGQGIPPHVDTPSAFEDGLVSLSLGSQVIMEFRHPDGKQLSVLLPHRSALVMTGESRYIWSHGITPRKSDIIPSASGGLTLSHREIRTSFTFRKITGVRHSDNKSENPSLPASDDSAAQLENQHVHQVYEEIAEHFSGTRHTPWPRIADFLRQQASGSVLLDVGCGNGKYFGINKNLFELGSDRSFNLAQICDQRGFQVFVSDILAVPVRSSTCDVCLCIAVIHHLSTQERRQKAVSELLRVLRPGGKALIYVWAMEQELNKVKSKYLKGKKQTSKLSEEATNYTEEASNKDAGMNADKSLFDGGSGRFTSQTGKDAEGEVAAECDRNSDGCVGNQSVKCDYSMNKLTISDCDNKIDHAEDSKKCKVNENTETSIQLDKSSDKNENVSSNDDVSEVERTHTDNEKNCDVNSDTVSEVCVKSESDSHASSKAGLQQPLAVHVNRTEFQQQDVLVPWQLKNKDTPREGNTYHRFYHVFQKGELERLCLQTEKCKVLQSYYDQGNWAVILEKL